MTGRTQALRSALLGGQSTIPGAGRVGFALLSGRCTCPSDAPGANSLSSRRRIKFASSSSLRVGAASCAFLRTQLNRRPSRCCVRATRPPDFATDSVLESRLRTSRCALSGCSGLRTSSAPHLDARPRPAACQPSARVQMAYQAIPTEARLAPDDANDSNITFVKQGRAGMGASVGALGDDELLLRPQPT